MAWQVKEIEESIGDIIHRKEKWMARLEKFDAVGKVGLDARNKFDRLKNEIDVNGRNFVSNVIVPRSEEIRRRHGMFNYQDISAELDQKIPQWLDEVFEFISPHFEKMYEYRFAVVDAGIELQNEMISMLEDGLGINLVNEKK